MVYVLLAIVLAAPLVGAAVAVASDGLRGAGRATVAGLTAATAASLAMLAVVAAESDGTVDAGGPFDLSIGRISTLLLVVVMGTATVVAGFSQRTLDDDGRAGRYFALIASVAVGSALVVIPATPLLLIAGWIASGWALVGLVGFERGWAQAAAAQQRIWQTLLVGDLALAAAVVLTLWKSDGLLTGDSATAVDQLRDASLGGISSLHIAMVLVVVAGASRSAMVPFHRWLIGTLAAPTPVSALVHAGLVSGAGLLLVRFAAPFVVSDPAVILAFVLGVLTVVIASAVSLTRSDVKGSLAWSTVSQMAFMVVQCAVGAFSSAVFHIAGHGMYKASLFLGAGDTASSGLRAKRRPGPLGTIDALPRWALSTIAASLAVGAAALVVPPDVGPAGAVLVYVFAWLTVAFGIEGWIRRGPLAPMPTVLVAVGGGIVAAFAYLGGLRLAEAFVKPSLTGIPEETIIGPVALIAVLAALASVVGVIVLTPGPSGQALRDRAYRFAVQLSEPAGSGGATGGPGQAPDFAAVPPGGDVRRAEIRAEVSDAAAVIAPQWPLSSFVAVNPLIGLESLSFDEATATARRWLGGRTHLPLEAYRRNHEAGTTLPNHLRSVTQERFADLITQGPMIIDGVEIDPVDIIITDLLHGPEAESTVVPRTAVQRCGTESAAVTALLDRVLSSWLRAYVEPPRWGPRRGDESFVVMAQRLMTSDPRLHGIASNAGERWVASLDSNPASMIDAAFTVSGVPADTRVDEARGHLCQLSGWSGLAKWRNEWAQPDEPRPVLAPIDLVAVRAALEALAIGSGRFVVASGGFDPSASEGLAEAALLEARVESVADALGESRRGLIEQVLSQVPADARPSLWLAAEERAIDERLLGMLDRLELGTRSGASLAQLVFCIDVRSEGLRREIEALDDVETFGFAGFFGVPMRIRRLGWDHHEPRCPVLVAPAIAATEHARPDSIGPVADVLARQRSAAGVSAAHSGAKYGPGTPFALAETVGWLTGPLAAAKTFVPRKATPPAPPATRVTLDDDEVLLEQRTFFAESVLNTMGLIDGFAPLVVLCGHTSRTVNNPHATALECGACAGASGDDNARAVAALLNLADVRHGLAERGITIPDETWFIAGLHDTASDRITFLDTADAPRALQPTINRVGDICEAAGQRQAATRSAHLPGPVQRVRERGADWAQVRPEWGLARNAAFIIGPRSMTEGLDLEGRAFLHGYNSEDDPSGRVLETIMTAPLVVGHWISAQYYFSTVDPEVFGAGNKLIHNPFGTTGVISGDTGDLRVGLPLQSTHMDGKPFHQPVRLLAIIAADPSRIDSIIANNPILQTLTEGQWLRIAARAQPHDRWLQRTPEGTWVDGPRARETHQSTTLTKETR